MIIIENIGDLKKAIEHASDEQRVDTWYHDTGRTLVAVGVSGENTDYSFYVFDDWDEALANGAKEPRPRIPQP